MIAFSSSALRSLLHVTLVMKLPVRLVMVGKMLYQSWPSRPPEKSIRTGACFVTVNRFSEGVACHTCLGPLAVVKNAHAETLSAALDSAAVPSLSWLHFVPSTVRRSDMHFTGEELRGSRSGGEEVENPKMFGFQCSWAQCHWSLSAPLPNNVPGKYRNKRRCKTLPNARRRSGCRRLLCRCTEIQRAPVILRGPISIFVSGQASRTKENKYVDGPVVHLRSTP